MFSIDGRLFTFSPKFLNPTADLSPLEPIGKDTFRIIACDDFDLIGENIRYEFDKSGQIETVYWGPNPMSPLK